MRASALEFRLRYLLHLIVYLLGFTAPWNSLLHLDAPGPNAHVWGLLAVYTARTTILGLNTMFQLLLLAGICCATSAAALRTWGTAYLGAGVVQGRTLHAGLVDDGPYRFVRNPIYIGTVLHTLALALLMPASGAIFSLAVIMWMQVRLVLGEEAFLDRQEGDAYLRYRAAISRWVPVLRTRIKHSQKPAYWREAFLSEIYAWGVAGSFAVAGWRYNAATLTQCVIVCVGVALVSRAVVREPGPTV